MINLLDLKQGQEDDKPVDFWTQKIDPTKPHMMIVVALKTVSIKPITTRPPVAEKTFQESDVAPHLSASLHTPNGCMLL
ncbi:MAG: hypothetical protein ACR2OA_07100 [Rubripirellula sp.]